jgi:hypothetical protein
MEKEENQIVLKVFRLMLENEGFFRTGICRWNGILLMRDLINSAEFYSTKNYLYTNLPPTLENSIYCWDKGDITPRIEWINEQIVKLEND